jgi:hypothetical protein
MPSRLSVSRPRARLNCITYVPVAQPRPTIGPPPSADVSEGMADS